VSRIGKKPVAIPKGVTVQVSDGMLKVKGPKGELSAKLHQAISVEATAEEAVVNVRGNSFDAVHGLWRALLNNMVTGVAKGSRRNLK